MTSSTRRRLGIGMSLALTASVAIYPITSGGLHSLAYFVAGFLMGLNLPLALWAVLILNEDTVKDVPPNTFWRQLHRWVRLLLVFYLAWHGEYLMASGLILLLALSLIYRSKIENTHIDAL